MTIVLHLIEASGDDLPPHDAPVTLLRHRFADAVADDGLASVLGAIDGLDPTDRLLVVHPDIDTVAVERLAALLRRSQRRRATIMIGHGLGPLGADMLVERLVGLLTDPHVGLDDAADWCRREQAMLTDIVWTMRAHSRWAHLDLRDRLRARLPGRQVRSQLGSKPHAVVASRDRMLVGLQMSGADVVVGGRDPSVIARTVEQLGATQARSVRIVGATAESAVVAEVVVPSPGWPRTGGRVETSV